MSISEKDSIPPWERSRERVVPVAANVPAEFLPWNRRPGIAPRQTPRKQTKPKVAQKEFVRPDYREYLDSPKWRRKRRKALKRAGNKCELCGRNDRLHVHHKTYIRLGREIPEDLQVLCEGCHSIEHEKKHPARDAVSREFRRIAGGF